MDRFCSVCDVFIYHQATNTWSLILKWYSIFTCGKLVEFSISEAKWSGSHSHHYVHFKLETLKEPEGDATWYILTVCFISRSGQKFSHEMFFPDKMLLAKIKTFFWSISILRNLLWRHRQVIVQFSCSVPQYPPQQTSAVRTLRLPRSIVSGQPALRGCLKLATVWLPGVHSWESQL